MRMDEIPKEEELEKIANLGFRFIDAMKSRGDYDSYRYSRKCLNRNVYNSIQQPENNLCYCGCEKTRKGKGKFASQECARIFYDTSNMIANQGELLYSFLVATRGNGCESCAVVPDFGRLEIDHIKEVAEGGGICWIDNYQLLCSSCHKAKTKKFVQERAKMARIESKLQLGQINLFEDNENINYL